MCAWTPRILPNELDVSSHVATFPWPAVSGYQRVHHWMREDLPIYAAWQVRDAWESLLKFLDGGAAGGPLWG